MNRRERTVYFEREPGAPAPLCFRTKRRIRFSEVDPMGIVWFGRYASFFEEGNAELGRRCGLSYEDFIGARLLSPVARYHVDYIQPLYLDEEFTIATSLIWNEGARMNMEYALIKADSSVAIRGYTVQLFIGADDRQVCMVSPPLLELCRQRWRAGEFKDLQA